MKISLNIPHMCYGQFATFRLTRTCFVHVLHTIEVAHPVFLASNRTFTGIFNYLPLYWGSDRPDSILYYPFSCCASIATLPEPQILLLPTVTCYMRTKWPCTEITSKNAKISTLDLYNFFFGWVLLHQTLRKFLLYTYIYIIYPKFAPILRSQKKVNFSCSVIKRGCACLAQLPCTRETKQERPRRIADRHD